MKRSQFAINPIQWNHTPEAFELRNDPVFRNNRLPDVYSEVAASGFDRIMLEMVDCMTVQRYKQILDAHELTLAPGIVPVPFPFDLGIEITPGTAAWVRWFDPVRRLAELSNHFGLDSAFLCPHMPPTNPRFAIAAATGIGFDQDRLDRVVEYIAAAAEILRYEGIRGALHNHVGTWIETQHEVEYVLDSIDATILGAGFDLGHLEWVGADTEHLLHKYRDRVYDLHIKDIDLGVAANMRESRLPYLSTYETKFFVEPGQGDVKFERLFAILGDEFEGSIIIEVDRASTTPFESAKTSWEWVCDQTPE